MAEKVDSGETAVSTSAQELVAEYQKFLRQSATEYQSQLLEARQAFEKSVAESQRIIQGLSDKVMAAATGQAGKKDPVPESAWTKGKNGEDYLVLNRHAADLVINMLDQLQSVIPDIAKLVGKRK
jgi:ElaB/YqjD/DUF883 family membrane-anchored ribosome-binding protein